MVSTANLHPYIAVKKGVIGSLTLKLPWRNLGKQAVVATVDEVYILAAFEEPDASTTPAERTAMYNEKQALKKR